MALDRSELGQAFEKIKELKSKKLTKKLIQAKEFQDLPLSIQAVMGEERSLTFFLYLYAPLVGSINLNLLVDKIIELDSPQAAIALISNKNYRKKLLRDKEQLDKLLKHAPFLAHLEWVQCLADSFSSSELASVDANLKAAADILKKQPRANEGLNNSIINNFFTGAYQTVNLDYFLKKKNTNFLHPNHLKNMFDLAQGKQIINLCWVLAKNRIYLLSNHILTVERTGGVGANTLKNHFTTNSSPEITEFLTYKPNKLTGFLFKNDPQINIDIFEDYLQKSHNPRQLLKAHGDWIVKTYQPKVSEVKIIKAQNVANFLMGNSAVEVSRNFHLLVKYKKGLLRKAIKDSNNLSFSSPNSPWAHFIGTDGNPPPRNEWLAMLLKENSALCKAICEKKSEYFISLLKLTHDPVSMIEKLISTVKSKDRAQVLFKAAIEVAKFTKTHPEYQQQFNKLMEMRFWCNGGYRTVNGIMKNVLTKELSQPDIIEATEADIKICLEDIHIVNSQLTKSQFRELAAKLKKADSHKILATKHYARLVVSNKPTSYQTELVNKSIYYALQGIESNRQMNALNASLFYGKTTIAEDAKKLMQQVGVDKFANGNLQHLFKQLTEEDVKQFRTYLTKELAAKLETQSGREYSDFVKKIKDRFNFSSYGVNFTNEINQLLEASVKADLAIAPSKSLPEAAKTFYGFYKTEPNLQKIVEPTKLTEKQVWQRIFYGAIINSDWELIEKNKQQFLACIPPTTDANEHYGHFQEKINPTVARELATLFTFNELHQLKMFTNINFELPAHIPLDHALDEKLCAPVLDVISDRQVQELYPSIIITLLDKNIKNKDFIFDILIHLHEDIKHDSLDNLFGQEALVNALTLNLNEQLNLDFAKISLDVLKRKNFTNAFTLVKNSVLEKATVTQLIEIASWTEHSLKNEILQQKIGKFTHDQLDETARTSLLNWLNSEGVFPFFQDHIVNILLLNKTDINFTGTIIDKLGEGKRLQILKDPRIDSDFILNNLNLLDLKKAHNIQTLSEVAKNALQKFVMALNTDSSETLNHLFMRNHYELYLSVLNNPVLLPSENKDKFYKKILPLFEKEDFVKSLALEENKQAAITIIESGNELLTSAFWNATKQKPLLVAQVLETEQVKSDAGFQYAEHIRRFSNQFPSHKLNMYAETYLEKARGSKEPAANVQPTSSGVINVVSEIAEETIESKPPRQFRYIEDIYQFIYENQNQNANFFIENLKSVKEENPKLLDKAYRHRIRTNHSISTKLEIKPIADFFKEKENQSNNQKGKSQQSNMIESKEPKTSTIDYSELKKARENYKLNIKKPKLTKIEADDISRILKAYSKVINKNRTDEISGLIYTTVTTVWIAYEAKKAQLEFINSLNSAQIKVPKTYATKTDFINYLRATYKAEQKDLDAALMSILEIANKYRDTGDLEIAEKYYADIVKCCSEDKAIDPAIYFNAILNLIQLYISEKSTEDAAKLAIKALFNKLFDPNSFTDNFIKENIKSIPLNLLESLDVFNVLNEEFNKDSGNVNANMMLYIEAEREPMTDIAKNNLKTLQNIIIKKEFITQFSEIKADIADEFTTLLRHIYKEVPDLLANQNVTFSLDTVLSTCDENLDIILFYLQDKQLSQTWLTEESDKAKLIQLSNQHEIIKFVLRDCYKHFDKQFEKNAFDNIIVVTQISPAPLPSEVQSLSVDDQSTYEMPPPPPPVPLADAPPPPPISPEDVLPPGAPPPPPPGAPPAPALPGVKLKPILKPKAEKEVAAPKADLMNSILAKAQAKQAARGDSYDIEAQVKSTPNPKPAPTPLNIAGDVMQAAIKRRATLGNALWNELYAACEKSILACFGDKISPQLKTELAEILKMIRNESNPDQRSVVNALNDNKNIKFVSDDPELKKTLADQMLALRKTNVKQGEIRPTKFEKSDTAAKGALKKTVVPARPSKAEEMKPEDQIDNIISKVKDKFVGDGEIIDRSNNSKIREDLLKIYQQYIEKRDTAPQAFNAKNFMAEKMSTQAYMLLITPAKQIKMALHYADVLKKSGVSIGIDQEIGAIHALLIKVMNEHYNVLKHGKIDLAKQLNARFFSESKQTAHLKSTITIDLFYKFIPISDKSLTPQKTFSTQLVGTRDLADDKEFKDLEEFIVELFTKLNSNSNLKIYRDECLLHIYNNVIMKVSPISRQDFEAKFDTYIWTPISQYAASISKADNVKLVRAIAKSGMFTKPVNDPVIEEKPKPDSDSGPTNSLT